MITPPHLHGVVRHEEDILYGQGEDVGGEEAGEQQPHRQLVVRQVAVSAHQQGVACTQTIEKVVECFPSYQNICW